MPKVYAFLAPGLEEVECLAAADVLMRGGVEVVLVSVSEEYQVTGSHHITVVTDKLISEVDCEDADVFFLPGGMPGTRNLGNCEKLCAMLQKAHGENKRIAAICVAPSVLGQLGILKGRTATCFSGFEDNLDGAFYTRKGVVTDGNITTASGFCLPAHYRQVRHCLWV